MRARTRERKNSPRQTKYVSASDHKLPFPVPARRCPVIFPRHLSQFILLTETVSMRRLGRGSLRGGGFLPPTDPSRYRRNRPSLLIYLLIYNLYIHDTTYISYASYKFLLFPSKINKKKINRCTIVVQHGISKILSRRKFILRNIKFLLTKIEPKFEINFKETRIVFILQLM